MNKAIAFILLIALFPIIIIISLVQLFFFSFKNIFFVQHRAGLNGIPFSIYKFRSINDNGKINIWGSLLRKTSLDEILQLLNILKSDMNFIGPRPLLVHYNQLYNNYQKQRLTIKPGITGWAQVNGKNNLNWNQKFELDIYYVQHKNTKLDLLILFKTIKIVFSFKTNSNPIDEFDGK